MKRLHTLLLSSALLATVCHPMVRADERAAAPSQPTATPNATPPALVGKLWTMSAEQKKLITDYEGTWGAWTGSMLGDSHAVIEFMEGSGTFSERICLYRKNADGIWETQMEGFWSEEPIVDGRGGVIAEEVVLEGNALFLRDAKGNILYVLLRLAPGESRTLPLDMPHGEELKWCAAHEDETPGPIRAELSTPAADKAEVRFTAADNAAAHKAAAKPDNAEIFTLYYTHRELAEPLLEQKGECSSDESLEAGEEAMRKVSVEIQLVKPERAQP